MTFEQLLPYLLIALGFTGAAVLAVALLMGRMERRMAERLESELTDRIENRLETALAQNRRETLEGIQTAVTGLSGVLTQSQQLAITLQDKRLAELNEQLGRSQDLLLQSVRESLKGLDERLRLLSSSNEVKLEQIRVTVDERLQKTLEDRLGQSFKLVSERLEQVSRGLGEMQTLANGVGDLKKVLSNVKNRGTLGEIQLGAILEDILAPGQYAKNIITKHGSGCPVEYAVRLPGDDGAPVYIPIDSKFPGDTYAALRDAYDRGNPDEINAAYKTLSDRIRSEAKDIHDKYIDPPNTTDFGILFLPFEGLYAEVVSRGMVEVLQRDFRVNIAGPSTMAALLNSLQMGFRTLAIQKRSGEVWKVLGAVKTEFDSFADVLQKAQKQLDLAHASIDTLVGTRTNVMRRKLRDVESLSAPAAAALLDDAEPMGTDEPSAGEDAETTAL